ncbi:MAG: response regulator [Blautia sp.]|jgi:two-component system response regulator YesN
MNQYNILLVDDEEDVLHAMERKINWDALGFHLAGTAGNGQEALELADQLHIDVVMTDIKMPFMDGLTLCRKLKENYRNMKVVIYSGFDEFEYAREAVHLEAEEYLLKPISAKDMENVFRKIKESLDKEFDERRNMDKLYAYYKQSLPAMQEQLFMSILEGKITEEKAQGLLETYEMNLKAPHYVAALLRVEENGTEDGPEAAQLAALSLRDIAKDYLSMSSRFYSAYYLQDVVIVFLMDFREEIEKVLYHLEQICKMGQRMLERRATAAVGQICDKLMRVSTSYQEARNAMEYRAIVDGPVIYINDVEPSPEESISLPEYDVQELLRAVKLGDREETQSAITAFVDSLKETSITPQQYQLACMEMITEFLKIGRSYKLGTKQIFGTETVPWHEIQKIPSLEELKAWLLEICTNLRRTLRKERNDSTMRLTEQAKAYIEKHYRESDLSAETLCRQLNVSATYFSTIFKKEVGQSFVAYLTKLRLEHAVELLRTTEDKTYVISEQVGYTEPNYFSYVFKKQYGISPSRYRANMAAEGEHKN